MLRYELEDYVQEHPAESAVNVNCVASWCAYAAADRVENLLVDLPMAGTSIRVAEWTRGRAGADSVGAQKE